MPRTPSTTQPVVILHGWLGSGPGHWQRWLVERLAGSHEVRCPELPDPGQPRLGPWLAALDEALAGLPAGGFDVLCHSLAVPLWLHRAARLPAEPAGAAGSAQPAGPAGSAEPAGPAPARVLLVAPPSPRSPLRELAEFLPPPLDAGAVRRAAGGTILVCGDDDPFCPEGARAAYGLPLKLPTTVVPGGGHLNGDSGYGPWPAVERWCSRPNLAFPL